jgi:hypothetical protein
MGMMDSTTKVVTAARWLVALCMTGCPATDDDMPSSDSGADSGGTETETETEAETATETETETATATDASSSTSEGEAVVPWSDVECDMEVCEGSDICFKPASYCTGPCEDNYQDLVSPPRRCEPFPTDCDPSNPISCLFETFCDGEEGSFYEGQLSCYGGADDCYCR